MTLQMLTHRRNRSTVPPQFAYILSMTRSIIAMIAAREKGAARVCPQNNYYVAQSAKFRWLTCSRAETLSTILSSWTCQSPWMYTRVQQHQPTIHVVGHVFLARPSWDSTKSPHSSVRQLYWRVLLFTWLNTASQCTFMRATAPCENSTLSRLLRTNFSTHCSHCRASNSSHTTAHTCPWACVEHGSWDCSRE